LYAQAIELHQQGIHLVSTDEKTGIQAFERLTPLSMQPTVVERLEFEYERHGTQCLIANLEVATGQVIAQLDRPAQKTFWLIFSRLLLLTQQVFDLHYRSFEYSSESLRWVTLGPNQLKVNLVFLNQPQQILA